MMSTDCIEKTVVLRAPLSRVWRALTDSGEFGSWFGVRVDGPFVPGSSVRGVLVGTTVNAEIAAAQQEFADIPFEIVIERMEPERLFSYRWHPYACDRSVDYTAEPMTLVTFVLEEATDGVKLTITESGFDRIPIERRAKAFSANEGGWAAQVSLIGEYLVRNP
jgi:uncharacterized protein YndB with AHSA1/START domain